MEASVGGEMEFGSACACGLRTEVRRELTRVWWLLAAGGTTWMADATEFVDNGHSLRKHQASEGDVAVLLRTKPPLHSSHL